MRRSRKRNHLVRKASKLFESRGFHATGIDMVLSEAGIAKMTLYNHFASKDDLIAAALRHKSLKVLNWLEDELTARTSDPKGRVLALFDAYQDWFEQDDFSGCMFQKAAGEFPAKDHPAHKEAANHKRRLYERLTHLTEGAGATDPAQLAEQLLLLLEGATAIATSTGATIAGRRAKRAAEILLAV